MHNVDMRDAAPPVKNRAQPSATTKTLKLYDDLCYVSVKNREKDVIMHKSPGFVAPEAITAAGERLLRIAQDVVEDDRVAQAPLSEFVQVYREWITSHRGRLGTQAEQAEQWQLLLYAMVTAPRIEEAIERLIRFGKVVWGTRGPSELRRDGDMAILVFNEPVTPGPEGLVAALWPLTLTLCELEFLANARFDGAHGTVNHARSLPEGIIRLLFAAPLSCDGNEIALIFPAYHLRRPIAVRAADLPGFFRQLLPLTLGARRDPPSIASVAAGLIRDDKLGPHYRETTLLNVAARLAMSAPTLRRRLKAEGTSYRQVKEDVYDSLAQNWLWQKEVAIETIAERLDFSDGFAFRRFFRRRHGISPSAFRAASQDTSTTATGA